MKTRTLIPVLVFALAVAAPFFLVPRFPSAPIRQAANLVVFTIGVILLGVSLFQRIVQHGPWDEFGANLLAAVGFLLFASPFLAGLPEHSTLGTALTLAGCVLLLVGIFWGARLAHGRRLTAK
jgi:peptidoglycan/LPS O-acetylase OafA/YrhL